MLVILTKWHGIGTFDLIMGMFSIWNDVYTIHGETGWYKSDGKEIDQYIKEMRRTRPNSLAGRAGKIEPEEKNFGTATWNWW